MKVILISKGISGARTLELGRWSRAFLSLCCLGVPLGMVGLGYFIAQAGHDPARDVSVDSLQDELDSQSKAVADLRASAQRKLQALTLTVTELEARMVRLDAMGERLTSLAGMDSGEFDFSRQPAVGGPLTGDTGEMTNAPSLNLEMQELEQRIADREQQLDVLQSLLVNRQIADDIYLSGRPVKKGWMSSPFGRRKDPFTGQSAWHEGVDFAGTSGADVVAVAAGVVTWSGERYGYGEMVEVNHGGGYSTRYAHNQENKVGVGDLVKKGQIVAKMGSSGRSTGPHVHYEVYKHGRPVDPASYIHRSRR
jgi:murein DD-endopeptidase MepM/ murein hydrolase activator NlpD